MRHLETFKCPSQPSRSGSRPGGCLGCVSGQWRPQGVTLWDSVDPNITGPLTFSLPFHGFRAAEDAGDGGDGSLSLLTTVPQALCLSQGPESPANGFDSRSFSLVPFQGL